MFAEATHPSAGVGVGKSLGALPGLSAHERAGRPLVVLMKQSVPCAALAAGTATRTRVALLRKAMGSR